MGSTDVSPNATTTTLIEDVLNAANATNSSQPVSTDLPVIKKVHDVMIVLILVSIMFSMGCHIKLSEFWSHLRRPFGIVVGMLSQFVMMPLIAFGLISAMRLNGLYAIGMLVIGCCPGGAVSNIFAYFCDGDVPLSIAMTLCSTVLAMGMMPLNMLLYGQYVDTGDIVIPYSRMATSLVVVSVPAGFGILFNWFFPKISPYITKWGSSLGGLLIVASQIMEVFIFPDLFSGIPPELYGATLLMPLTGMIAGYGASWVCRRPEAVRRTVAIESGIQNVGTALTIVSLSFQFEDQKAALVFPWLYAFSMSFLSFLICVTYHFYKKHCSRSKSHDLTDSCNTVQSVVDKKDNEKAQLADQRIIGHGVFNPTFQN